MGNGAVATATPFLSEGGDLGTALLQHRNQDCIALSDGGDTAMRVLGQEALAFSRARPGSGAAFLSELWRRTERASEGVCELTFFYGCTCCGRATPVHSRRGRPRERGRGVEGCVFFLCACVSVRTRATRNTKVVFPQPTPAIYCQGPQRAHTARGGRAPL